MSVLIPTPAALGNGRARRSRKGDRLLERRQRISDAYARGDTMTRIAQRERVSVATVFKDLEWVREQYLLRATQAREVSIAAELLKLEALEREAWWAWERSKQPREETQTERVDAKAARSKVSIKRHERDGDPRFLEVVRGCIEDRRKLLGLDAPTKIDVEMDIRAWARAEGLDEELAVQEAQRQLKMLPPPEGS